MRLTLIAVLVVSTLGAPSRALATGQASDILLWNGTQYKLFSNPLEDYYGEYSRPAFMVKPYVTSSGNWRGYVATWAIRDDALYLVDIDTWLCPDPYGPSASDDCTRPTLRDLFGDKAATGAVLASWFTGELAVPDGEQLQYAHMGYGTVYEKTFTIAVKAGRVVGSSVIDNRGKVLPATLELERKELEKMRDPRTAAN